MPPILCSILSLECVVVPVSEVLDRNHQKRELRNFRSEIRKVYVPWTNERELRPGGESVFGNEV